MELGKFSKVKHLEMIIHTAIDQLEKCCRNNLMTVNTKTNNQFFSLKKKLVGIKLHCRAEPLQRTENAKYVGVRGSFRGFQ